MEQESQSFEADEVQAERTTELPPVLQEFAMSVISSQDRMAIELGQQNLSGQASFDCMDGREFAQRFSAMFLAVYKPSENRVYVPNIPKKFQFQQALALGHELTHASHEPAARQVSQRSNLESAEYANLKEGLTSYISELTLITIPVENEIYAQRLKEARKLKKYGGSADQEIIAAEVNAFRHSYHRIAETLVNSVENGQQQLLEGWFSGDLSGFEESVRLKFGDDFLEQLKGLNFKNRQDFIVSINQNS